MFMLVFILCAGWASEPGDNTDNTVSTINTISTINTANTISTMRLGNSQGKRNDTHTSSGKKLLAEMKFTSDPRSA